MPEAEQKTLDPEDRMRADLYGLLGQLIAAPPTAEQLKNIARIKGDDTDLGRAINSLAHQASDANQRRAREEYNLLYMGLVRGELLPYASFYLTGFLHEMPLAKLREDMLLLGVKRTEDRHEPEDHIASMMEIMQGLIRGSFASGRAPLDTQRKFFNDHLAKWAPHFFTDLEAAENAELYAPLGTIGRLFMEIEFESFRLLGKAA